MKIASVALLVAAAVGFVASDAPGTADTAVPLVFHRGEILRIDPGRSDAVSVTHLPDRTEHSPDLSADGSKVVFDDCPPYTKDGPCVLATVNIDGSARRRLEPPLAASVPRWSPGGDRIAFAMETNGGRRIGVANPDGSAVQLLQSGSAPDWSPDGTQLVYANRNRLWTTTLAAGARPRPLTAEIAGADSPTWSPSGHRIAFVRNLTGSGVPKMAVSIVNEDGTGLHDVTSMESIGRPAWNHDETELSFHGSSYVRFLPNLFVIDLRTSARKIVANPGSSPSWASPSRRKPCGGAYWLAASDGGMFTFGEAPFLGSTGGRRLNKPVVAIAATPTGQGYWLAAADGGVFSFGDAGFSGSTGGRRLNKPVVAIAATPTGEGYWLAAADGGVFAFGDAKFRGATSGMTLNKPIVAVAATPTGQGYWLAAADGGVFSFGDASFFGSMAERRLNKPVVALVATATGRGYWLVGADGGLFGFGDAPAIGSAASPGLLSPAVAAAIDDTGGSLALTFADGQIIPLGRGDFCGSPYNGRRKDIVGLAFVR